MYSKLIFPGKKIASHLFAQEKQKKTKQDKTGETAKSLPNMLDLTSFTLAGKAILGKIFCVSGVFVLILGVECILLSSASGNAFSYVDNKYCHVTASYNTHCVLLQVKQAISLWFQTIIQRVTQELEQQGLIKPTQLEADCSDTAASSLPHSFFGCSLP